MPCTTILTNGHRKGRKCDRVAIHDDGTHCGYHVRIPGDDVHATARKELNAYVYALKHEAFRIYTVEEYDAFEGRIKQWQRVRKAAIDAIHIDTLRTMSFPYGDAVPVEFNNIIEEPIVIQDDPLPQPAARQPRNVPPQWLIDELNAQRAAAVPPPPPPRAPRRARPARQRRNVPRLVDELNAQWLIDELNAQGAAAVPPPPLAALAAFAADKQNIHTVQSVEMTKSVVGRVLKIAVPEEYRWNMKNVSKTAGEIIAECKLTPYEMSEMMNRYIHDDDVYEMGKGIYGKVLDGVWQYIRNSPDKADMCRILKQELKDNIGMCAQGNLTRLCNVLAGYMDGIGPQESVSERLGREMPLLMDDEDRITKAKTLMMSLNVPEAEWAPWLDALA